MKRHPNYEDIPEKAEVFSIHEDGEIGNYGIVKGIDLHYMLRGYTFDKELGLWFHPNHKEWAYEVKPIK